MKCCMHVKNERVSVRLCHLQWIESTEYILTIKLKPRNPSIAAIGLNTGIFFKCTWEYISFWGEVWCQSILRRYRFPRLLAIALTLHAQASSTYSRDHMIIYYVTLSNWPTDPPCSWLGPFYMLETNNQWLKIGVHAWGSHSMLHSKLKCICMITLIYRTTQTERLLCWPKTASWANVWAEWQYKSNDCCSQHGRPSFTLLSD